MPSWTAYISLHLPYVSPDLQLAQLDGELELVLGVGGDGEGLVLEALRLEEARDPVVLVLRETWGRCRGDTGEMQGRYEVVLVLRDGGEIWGGCRGDAGEIWVRYRGDAGETWGRHGGGMGEV